MLARKFGVLRVPLRSLSSRSAVNTEVVLLHFGQPWTEFYAKQFLQNRTAIFYNIPSFLHRFIPKESQSNDKVRGCIAAYGSVTSLEGQVENLAKNLEESLGTLVPEHGPFKVSRIFHFDEKTIAEKFEILKTNRSKRFIFVPLYPHFFNADSGTLLSQIGKHIGSTTVPVVENNKEVAKSRVEQNSDYSFDVSAIHRWNDHPVVSEYWAKKIQPELSKLDGIVFAVPRKTCYDRKEYERAVWATCERVMTRLAHSVPWRIGFYNSWDSWDLPYVKESVQKQVKRFGGEVEKKRIGIVPISDVFETFDTLYVLPKLVKDLNNTILFKPDYESDQLVQGLAEILKNHLMGRPHRQLEVAEDHSCARDSEDRKIFY